MPWNSYIHAVDKNRQQLPALINEVSIGFNRADFSSGELALNDLDGILMANSLHFIRNKMSVLKNLENYFRAGRRFVIVEYENRWPSPWVPYPVRYAELSVIAVKLGYSITRLQETPSRFGGLMYSALLTKQGRIDSGGDLNS